MNMGNKLRGDLENGQVVAAAFNSSFDDDDGRHRAPEERRCAMAHCSEHRSVGGMNICSKNFWLFTRRRIYSEEVESSKAAISISNITQWPSLLAAGKKIFLATPPD